MPVSGDTGVVRTPRRSDVRHRRWRLEHGIYRDRPLAGAVAESGMLTGSPRRCRGSWEPLRKVPRVSRAVSGPPSWWLPVRSVPTGHPAEEAVGRRAALRRRKELAGSSHAQGQRSGQHNSGRRCQFFHNYPANARCPQVRARFYMSGNYRPWGGPDNASGYLAHGVFLMLC